MKLPPANMNSFWASLLVEELIRNGIDYFCLAPGSRCTPLTVAVAEHPKAIKTIHYDERGLAFHALGYSRATGKPAVVITTSGSAVANLMPAVVEAAMERIPMLCITADRPPELRDTSANQTIDQIKVFGEYVRWFIDLPCPDAQVPCQTVLTTIDQAIYRCCWPEGGPVHVNCMFREPLAPEKEDAPDMDYLSSVDDWIGKEGPCTEYFQPLREVPPEALDTLINIVSRTERGLVVLGGIQRQKEQRAVLNLLKILNWPVCADITSGLRMGDQTTTVVGHCDVLLREERFVQEHRPETILHLGGRLVSKHVARFLSRSSPDHYILATNHPRRQDPGHEVTMRLESDLMSFCNQLIARLAPNRNVTWLTSWQDNAAAAGKTLQEFSLSGDDLNEPAVSLLLSQQIPESHGLFLASSMPVRDMDIFADPLGPAVQIGANRGASGIDGTLATASGFAEGLQRPVTLFMGDLAFLHDLNSLNFLRHGKYPVIAVVVNNNGGGIFSLLPIARFEKYLEPYFITPHGLSFENVSKMYGLDYYQPKSRKGFVDAYHEAVGNNRSAILEIQIDREENLAVHNRLICQMLDAIKNGI